MLLRLVIKTHSLEHHTGSHSVLVCQLLRSEGRDVAQFMPPFTQQSPMNRTIINNVTILTVVMYYCITLNAFSSKYASHVSP